MQVEEAEAQLRATFAQNDQDRAEATANADQALEAAAAAGDTAGQEFDAEISQAEQDYAAGEESYQQQLDTLDTSIATAQASIDAVENPDSAADEIDAIGGIDQIELNNIPAIGTVTVTTGGTPDCSGADVATAINQALTNVAVAVNSVIADIETKVNASIGQQNTQLANIVIALDVLDENITSLSIDQIKAALQAVKNGASATRAIAIEPLDVESAKVSFNSIINNMFLNQPGA